MTGGLAFVVQALILVTLPYALWRIGRLDAVVPWVVTQIAVGIALGPSVLGHLAPAAAEFLFEASTLGALRGVGSIAVLLFAFVTGLHLDIAGLRRRGGGFALMATGSIVVPTLLGAVGGALIARRYPELMGPAAGMPGFAMAVGICAGVTALPVLGAILREMALLGQRLGQLALALAAANDAALWVLMAALLAGGTAHGTVAGLLVPIAGLTTWLAVLATAARPLMRRFASPAGIGEGGLVAGCAVALASAVVTELLGLHMVLGAFLAGAVMPIELRRALLDRLEAAIIVVLMPFFFAVAGLETTIDLGSSGFLAAFALVTAAAVLGKIGGTALAARLAGEPPGRALALGCLMQTKGLMEVVVASVLRDAGIIGPAMFSALILMALVTTLIAMPLTRLVLARRVPSHAT